MNMNFCSTFYYDTPAVTSVSYLKYMVIQMANVHKKQVFCYLLFNIFSVLLFYTTYMHAIYIKYNTVNAFAHAIY